MCLYVCVCSHAYVYALLCPHLLPIHSAKDYESETDTEKKEGLFPCLGHRVLWKDSRPLSFIFIHSPCSSSSSAAISPATPPTTTKHPPTPTLSVSLCPPWGSPFQPRLPFVPSWSSPPLVLSPYRAADGSCFWDPAEQTHTPGPGRTRGVEDTPDTFMASLKPSVSTLNSILLCWGVYCARELVILSFWDIFDLLWWKSLSCFANYDNIDRIHR